MTKRTGTVWLRLGDAGDYESFDGPYEAGERVGEITSASVDGYTGKGVIIGPFQDINHVSLYWGDNDAQPNDDAELTERERQDFEFGIAHAQAERRAESGEYICADCGKRPPDGTEARCPHTPIPDADHDQRNDEAAAKWQGQVEALPRVIVYVKGGLVQWLTCDSPVRIAVIDADTDGDTEAERLTDKDGDQFDARYYVEQPTPDAGLTDLYFDQFAKIEGYAADAEARQR